MRSRLLAGISALTLFAGACLQDASGPVTPNQPKPAPPIAAPTIGDDDLRILIEQQLTCLYQQGLLPNEQSSLGKFRSIQSQVAANDLQGATEATGNLVEFIELKFSQYTGPATIDCNPPVPGYPNPVSVAQLKDDVIANLWAYVGLTGEICEVPATGPKFCKTEDQTSGFVYFPDEIYEQITFVGLEQNPPDLPALQNLFDEYPNRIRIVTSGISDFSSFAVKPLVVVCFDDATLPADQSLIARLLLGALHDNTGFEFLPPADFSAYPPEVLQEAENVCGPPPSPGPASLLGRLTNSIFDLFLPRQLMASALPPTSTYGGVGGSTGQFSGFGVVDPGMKTTGGVGGSTGQFAPPALVAPGGGPAKATTSGSTVTGDAGEIESDAADLPAVKVVAPASLTGIPGVLVTFALIDPVTAPYSSSPSLATLCGATTVTTDAQGVASLPCLNFGTKAGYKNLRITFDPTGVDPLACILNESGACDNSEDLNFLVETKPGAAALVRTYMPPAAPTFAQTFTYPGTPPAFSNATPAPQAIVTDQYNNGVSGVPIVWTTNTINGSSVTVNGGGVSGAGGLASVTAWTLGDGANLLSADISAVAPGALAAEFVANTPTGVSGFSCGLGASKTDLGFLSIKRITTTIRTINLWMSVTGESSALSAYNASITVHTGIPSATNQVGSGGGVVQLPGNNGNPTPVSFTLTDQVFSGETSGTQTLWIQLTFSNLPATRKLQVWYQNATFRSNQPCFDSKAYAPGSTTSFKRGLSINVTN